MTIGFSSCPNDTFIFDAMIHGRIDTEGISFEPVIEDVEALNRRAMAGELDATKLSYAAFARLFDRYALLAAGSALGRGCGPLLVAKTFMPDEAIDRARIAIPGQLTTANFLFSLKYPKASDKHEYVFSDIEDAVLRSDADCGLIIHENRFTYAQKGLVKIADLGEYWEQTTGMPIPLGGIAVNRRISSNTQQTLNRVLRRSVEYAFAHPNDVMPYVRQHAQAMDEVVMKAHIDLYVNDYTIDLGPEGRGAVEHLFARARQLGLMAEWNGEIYAG